ncbi:hypothetical protein FRC11_004402 [Ceratobasidium sp. 423]|nr:hypothetical protein FRC11_004402 [Ceratobasidium sp. 423]
MPKSSSGSKSRDRALKEAAKALSVAAKSLALASDALSRLYDTDEDEDDPKTDNSSISVENEDHLLPHTVHTPPKPIINYEDSDDEYMVLAREAISAAAMTMGKAPETQTSIEENKSIWSEMQNNFGSVEMLGKGNTESESTRTVDKRPIPSSSKPLSGVNYNTLPEPAPQTFSGEVNSSNQTKQVANPVANSSKWGMVSAAAREPFDVNSATGTPTNDPRPGEKESFANLKNRWAAPTELQHKVLRPLRTGSDILLLHASLKSHIHAVLVHCVQVLKKERYTSNPVGAISVLVIVPQQATGRLYLQYANELLSDFNLPHKAMLLPGGGSDVVIEAERMSTERIDILISSPRVFVNHVNNNANLSGHLSRIRLVVYAGTHELTNNDAFLSFQFNMIKKRMPTRAKSPRQIIIASLRTDDHIQVFANRALTPGYATIYGGVLDDDLRLDSWDDYLKP